MAHVLMDEISQFSVGKPGTRKEVSEGRRRQKKKNTQESNSEGSN